MFSCFPGPRASTLFLAQGEQVRCRSGRKSVQAEQAWLFPPPARLGELSLGRGRSTGIKEPSLAVLPREPRAGRGP